MGKNLLYELHEFVEEKHLGYKSRYKDKRPFDGHMLQELKSTEEFKRIAFSIPED